MTDRLLDAAANAYHQATRTGSGDPVRLRRRLLASLAVRQKRRHLVTVWLLPAAAALLTGAAVAAPGTRLYSAIMHAITASSSPPEARSSARRAEPRATVADRKRAIPSEPCSEQPAVTTAPGTDERRTGETRHDAERVDRPEPARRIPRRIELPQAAPSDSGGKGSSSERSATARELALFRAAQRLHFSERDPARAVEAWEDYLAQFPHGVLSKEARFNRALCLLRLGQSDAAASALGPLSRDGAEGYRTEDARALVRALKQE